MVESSLVMADGKIVDFQVGSPMMVEFDFLSCWNFRDPGIHLDFYHVHPRGMLWYSSTDENCMRGFKIAFNKDFGFHIINFPNDDIDDLSHIMVSYQIDNKSGSVEKVGHAVNGVRPEAILILKSLSYGKLVEVCCG